MDDKSIAIPVIAYCETGAFSDPIKELCRANLIKVIHFPYDADDRAWHENNKNKVSFAIPSLATCDTTQVYCSDDFLISDMDKSDKYDAIGSILKMDHRKHDVRHFDSAYKSGARVFLTNDKNFRNHRAEPYDNKCNETMYYYTDNESNSLQLVGKSSYAVTFPKGQLPPVKGFWSLTVYNPEHVFAPNAINRFALGTKNKTLKYNSDGSLTIYIGRKSPGADKEPNWIPAPAGNFSIWLRAYWPDKAILDGSWKPPVVSRLR